MPINYSRISTSAYPIFVYIMLVLFFFIKNPQALNFSYGDGGGRYADRVDSFSEGIVRNTIKRNILNKSDNSFFPIMTRGYSSGDYSYYEDGYRKHTTNLSLQTVPATIIAKMLNINTERKLDIYFGVLRLINALSLAFFLCFFFFFFCKVQKIKHHFIIPFVIGGSAGFIFFSQNLYFASALMLMPASLIAFQLSRGNRCSKIPIFLLGVAYFLRGYEFATIFALLTAFSAAIFANGDGRNKLKLSVIAFGIICLSFIFSVSTHVILVSADSGWVLSLTESAQKAFKSLQYRTASLDGVPFPFGPQFVQKMNERWSTTAFSLTKESIKITEMNVIMFIGFIAALRLKAMSNVERIIITYGVVGYLSWYIFAYQHIMWHVMYDWYIFSLTLGLAFSLLTIIYINRAIEFAEKALLGKDR